MIEKVNPAHPDKVADRIAGAIVDLAYTKQENPKIAVEVLIGHGVCHIIAETSVEFEQGEIEQIVMRLAGAVQILKQIVQQDKHLADNQQGGLRCGDNGIFRGVPLTEEQIVISEIASKIYGKFGTDGKYILTPEQLTVCQSNADAYEIMKILNDYGWNYVTKSVLINPLGHWTGGTDVDTGATNRKLGSDMADSVTGGGIHGKDLSKADVSVNIYAFAKAQVTGEKVEMACSIGDETVGGIPYEDIVNFAREYINRLGGFEKLAEWGLF